VLDDDVAEIDADAELDAALFRDTVIAQCHRALQRDSAAHRIDDAGELDEEPVAGRFDDPPAIFRYRRVRQLAADRLQRCERVPSSSSPINRE
jgi:hypothetical protein